jgi:hypothetical protein
MQSQRFPEEPTGLFGEAEIKAAHKLSLAHGTLTFDAPYRAQRLQYISVIFIADLMLPSVVDATAAT